MNKLLIVADHPSLHRGYSTVGHHIARGLQQTGRWSVEYVGRYAPAGRKLEDAYRVFGADADDDDACDEQVMRFVRDLTSDVRTAEGRRLLLSIGGERDQSFLLDRLEALGIRDLVQFVAYMPLDRVPLPPPYAHLLRRIDLVVPFTHFAGRGARALCAGEKRPIVSEPIPHGVDTAIFRPLDAAARRDVRQQVFGVDDRSTVIGFFGRNSGHKHPELAVQIFAALVHGRYLRCHTCRRVTLFELDPIDGSAHAPATCAPCGSGEVGEGQVAAAARLYLHTELLSRQERRYSGGWDLELLASRLEITGQVLFDRSLRVGEGVPVAELARRMGACDLHLLPFDRGGWELTVLETGACGVPNVITDVSAPPEYAAAFSELVPPAARIFGAEGTRGIMDVGRAIEAILDLLSHPDRRRQLGRSGVRVADAHAWEHVVRSWDRVLGAAAASLS
jgi:glycosyltransferase involved in cell wall biosynthesis